jgi:hypothetical protein
LFALLGLFGGGFDFDSPNNKRDVLYLGSCDEGAIKLAELLGFADEVRSFRPPAAVVAASDATPSVTAAPPASPAAPVSPPASADSSAPATPAETSKPTKPDPTGTKHPEAAKAETKTEVASPPAQSPSANPSPATPAPTTPAATPVATAAD